MILCLILQDVVAHIPKNIHKKNVETIAMQHPDLQGHVKEQVNYIAICGNLRTHKNCQSTKVAIRKDTTRANGKDSSNFKDIGKYSFRSNG